MSLGGEADSARGGSGSGSAAGPRTAAAVVVAAVAAVVAVAVSGGSAGGGVEAAAVEADEAFLLSADLLGGEEAYSGESGTGLELGGLQPMKVPGKILVYLSHRDTHPSCTATEKKIHVDGEGSNRADGGDGGICVCRELVRHVSSRSVRRTELPLVRGTI